MARVELMLRENVRYLGKVGDVVTVAAGYARNYLIPNKLAVKATAENRRVLARKRERIDAEEAARNAELAARVAVLEGMVLETTERSDENGHLYGSVNAARVAELLKAFSDLEKRVAALEATPAPEPAAAPEEAPAEEAAAE